MGVLCWKKPGAVPPPTHTSWKMMPCSIPTPGLGALLHAVQPLHPPLGASPADPHPTSRLVRRCLQLRILWVLLYQKKLLKRQSQLTSPPPQGSENGQLFLSTQPQWDHQFSKVGLRLSPSHPWPKPVVRVVHHVGTELSATLRPAEHLSDCTASGAAKLHLPKQAPSPDARAESAACQRSQHGSQAEKPSTTRQRESETSGHPSSSHTARGKPSS